MTSEFDLAEAMWLRKMRKQRQVKTISGVPPLTFKAKGSNLKDYRIYGNTQNGESVGDRTGNLFDGEIEQGTISADGILRDVSNIVRAKNFTVLDAGTYTIQSSNNVGEISVFIFTYTVDGTFIERLPSDWIALPYSFTLSERAKVKIVFEYTRGEAINPTDVKNIMLNSGSTALPYEPYGYKVPVTVKGKNLFDKSKPANILKCYLAVSTLVSNVDTRTIFIECKPSTTYTVSKIQGKRFAVGWSDKLPAPGVELQEKVINYNASSITITTGLAAKYLVAYIYNAGQDAPITVDEIIASVQIEKGSTATPYEPYHTPVTTPIYLPEPIKMVGDEAEYIDYAEQKQHRVRKNLLQNTATSQTIKGVTFTVNADGSITCSGILTSGEYADLVISGVFLGDTDILENGNYVVSCANGSNIASLLVGNSKGEVGRVIAAEINISANLTWAMLRIRQADPAITLYPMIRKADIEDDTYEPYIENTDLNVTLPALPTISGINILSVDTTVQPSRVDVKGGG